jgi:hypothetical protein
MNTAEPPDATTKPQASSRILFSSGTGSGSPESRPRHRPAATPSAPPAARADPGGGGGPPPPGPPYRRRRPAPPTGAFPRAAAWRLPAAGLPQRRRSRSAVGEERRSDAGGSDTRCPEHSEAGGSWVRCALPDEDPMPDGPAPAHGQVQAGAKPSSGGPPGSRELAGTPGINGNPGLKDHRLSISTAASNPPVKMSV